MAKIEKPGKRFASISTPGAYARYPLEGRNRDGLAALALPTYEERMAAIASISERLTASIDPDPGDG